MASSLHFASPLFLIATVALLISPAHSQTCTSQTFSSNFSNCADLPTLRASIHWTYTPTARPNPTLAIAFSAPPARPAGWVAWALNPTSTGMLGAQSLIAFRDTNGSMVVRTYNISAYSAIAESRISYGVLSSRAEFSDGVMRIFATLALPPGGAEVNQVWQVGSSVSDGVPVRHEFAQGNLNSRNTLQLAGTAAGPATAPTSGTGSGNRTGAGAPPVTQSGNDRGGSSILGIGFGLYGSLVLLGAMVLGV